MKKIIALALALIMALSMGVVALAADTTTAVGVASTCTTDCKNENHLHPGAAFWFTSDCQKGWKISDSWTKGGALVDDVKWLKADDDNAANGAGWYLILKENYTITSEKDLVGKVVFTEKGKKTPDTKTFTFDLDVANCLVEIVPSEDKDYPLEINTAANNTLYQAAEECPGYVEFNKGALLGCLLNMAAEEKAFMYNDESMIEALEEKFPEAELECYNFGGAPTFKNAAEFTLQADYADQYYIYAYVNGKLEAQDAEWDSIEGVYKWETKSPASYVISDVELVAAADDAAQNPDTGANDVVGVAAALAVVSLVAAGAVSLKK